jgi:pimeloyl-ACP methyl ester carboxylesterase
MTLSILHGRERLMDGLPMVERTIELAGISTAVLEGGSGEPVVLLHGPGEHALKWLRVIPELVRSHRVIAPDLPGHGSSAGSITEADQLIGWLRTLLERIGPGPVTVVGQVVGGAVAARLAATGDHRIARLVLVDTLGLAPFQPAAEFAAALGEFLARPDRQTFDGLWRYCAHDAGRLRRDMGERWEAYAEYTLELMRSPDIQASLHRIMDLFGFPAIPDDELSRIDVPTALIWGREDLATSVTVAERASARFGWPLHIVEGAADDPAMEKPDGFLQALRAVLREQ